MKENAIFFFSGTGNSFDIAKRLSEKIRDTDLFNIANISANSVSTGYKRIGFIFPVYGFTMPNIVHKFISEFTFSRDTYYFCVATMGAFALGALYRTAEAVNKARGHLDYATVIYMPENYILFSKVPSDNLINKHLKNSINRIKNIAGDILLNKAKPAKKPFTYKFVEKTVEREKAKWADTAKDFHVSDSCGKCRKCVRLCPVSNISFVDNAVIFSNHCECCLLCIHSCPKQSINYKDKTKRKKRYINPNINIEDMKTY